MNLPDVAPQMHLGFWLLAIEDAEADAPLRCPPPPPPHPLGIGLGKRKLALFVSKSLLDQLQRRCHSFSCILLLGVAYQYGAGRVD